MSKLILLIDDDEDEACIFTEALKGIAESCKCMYIKNAENGVKLLSSLVPDYIFIDINMPKMNGFECLSAIKKIDNCKNIPVILYSTGANEVIRNKALALGAAYCIGKTTSIAALSEVIQKILKHS